jgi:hypothetical protein
VLGYSSLVAEAQRSDARRRAVASPTPGSRATDWQPATMPSSLTVRRADQGAVDKIVIDWGLLYPTLPAIGPPVLLRATDYNVEVSSDHSIRRQ